MLRSALSVSPGLRRIGAGYAAKVACSGLFVSGRQLAALQAEDLEGVPGVALEVDRQRKEVRAQVGSCVRRAVFREGIGGALVQGDEDPPRPTLPARPERADVAQPWPEGEAVGDPELPAAARAALSGAVAAGFAEPNPRRPRRTRAVVVVHRGRIVCEQYAPGFGPEMPLLGWSMTKSVTNALVGVLVQQGKLDVQRAVAAPEWERPDDPRRALTFDHLLRMSSGLRFWEQYWNPLSHVASMLFARPAAAAYAASFPLVAAPDARWSYASGTSNVIARALRAVIGGDHADYLSFPARALFDRIGMRSAQLEVDPSGHFVGSSFSYATARDWARFGLLYLRDGVWAGERILPEGWVDYTRRPTPAAPLGEYGAHFWLNAGNPHKPARRMHPDLPRDVFFARGFEEQSISVVPSRELVVVRLGQTADRSAWDLGGFLNGILAALPG